MLSRNYSDNVNVRTSFGTYPRFGFAARDVLNFKPLSAKVYVNVLGPSKVSLHKVLPSGTGPEVNPVLGDHPGRFCERIIRRFP
jgi:hypothetical protein